MINVYSSDLILKVDHVVVANVPVSVATLMNGTALVVAKNSLSLYRNASQVGDALGNGLVNSVTLPIELTELNHQFIAEHRAGYVGLNGGYVLLITLNDVQLFPSKEDALHNRNEIARLSLAH